MEGHRNGTWVDIPSEGQKLATICTFIDSSDSVPHPGA